MDKKVLKSLLNMESSFEKMRSYFLSDDPCDHMDAIDLIHKEIKFCQKNFEKVKDHILSIADK